MSIIGRKPFVETIIGSCNSTQAKSVSTLLNNLGSATTVSLFNTSTILGTNYELSSSLKTKVTHVHFMLDSNKIIDGILVYLSDSKCGLFGFNDDTGIVTEFSIDPVAKTWVQINEHLTAEELRQVVGDVLIEKGEADAVDANPTGAATEVLSKLKVADTIYSINGIQSSVLEANVVADTYIDDDGTKLLYRFSRSNQIENYDFLILTGSLSMCWLLSTNNATYLANGLLGCMTFPYNSSGATKVIRFRLQKPSDPEESIIVKTDILASGFDDISEQAPKLTLIGVKIG